MRLLPHIFISIKKMQDHNLFQAICRINRLDDEDKEYSYIIDYKDLFNSLAISLFKIILARCI